MHAHTHTPPRGRSPPGWFLCRGSVPRAGVSRRAGAGVSAPLTVPSPGRARPCAGDSRGHGTRGGRRGRVQRGGVGLKNKGVSRGGAGGGPEAGGAERRGWARLGSARPGYHEPLQGVQVPAHRGPAAPQGGERRGTLPAVRYRGAGVAGPGLPAGGGGATPVRRGSGSSCCRHRRYGGVVPGSPTRCPVTVRQRRPGGPSLAPTASRPDSLSRGALQLGAGGGPQPFPGRYRPPNLARGLLRCSQCR